MAQLREARSIVSGVAFSVSTALVAIGERPAGPRRVPYLTAEIGSHHKDDVGLSDCLVKAVHGVAADAVILQSRSLGSLVERAEYGRNTWYFRQEEAVRLATADGSGLPAPVHHVRCGGVVVGRFGIASFSSWFASEGVGMLADLGVLAHKIVSKGNDQPVQARGVGGVGARPALHSTIVGHGSEASERSGTPEALGVPQAHVARRRLGCGKGVNSREPQLQAPGDGNTPGRLAWATRPIATTLMARGSRVRVGRIRMSSWPIPLAP